MGWASSRLAVSRTARTANTLRPRLPRRAIRYIPASIIPQAILHASAANSIVRMAKRSAVATLTAPVMVRAIIKPNRISESRSTGSSTRPGSLMRCPPNLRHFVRQTLVRLASSVLAAQSKTLKERTYLAHSSAPDLEHQVGDDAFQDCVV